MNKNNFFSILSNAYKAETLYQYEVLNGSLHEKTGLKLIGAFLGRIIFWFSWQSNRNKFIDLFEKAICQNQNATDPNLTERVRLINPPDGVQIRAIAILFRNHLDCYKYDCDYASDIFQGISQNDRHILVQAIYGLEKGALTEGFLSVIKEIPQDHRVEILINAAILNNRRPIDRVGFLETFTQIAKGQPPECIGNIFRIIQDSPFDSQSYLDQICLIPEDNRSDLVSYIADLPENEKGKLFKFLSSMQPQRRSRELIELAYPILHNIDFRSSLMMEDFFQNLERIPKEQRSTELIHALALLFKRPRRLRSEGAQFTPVLKEITEEKRADIIIAAVHFFPDVEDSSMICKIFKAFSSFSAEQLKELKEINEIIDREIKKNIDPICPNNPLLKLAVLKTLTEIPKEQKTAEAVQSIFFLYNICEMDDDFIPKTLNQFGARKILEAAGL